MPVITILAALTFGFAPVPGLDRPDAAPPGLRKAESTCPPAPDHTAELEDLIAEVQAAPNEGAARAISNRMWALWADAPDEPAQAILDRGMTQRRSFDLLGAQRAFDRLIDYCPDYAEGYNQRAFVAFLRQDYAAALPDLDRALEISPRHVAAMSGRALSLIGLGRLAEARVALSQALELNPWLPERRLIAPGGALADVGRDL
ncbi:tetratricopeptide repeat protein [Chachezhania antarctica]|uniref:tetratricopeptide repeat protein n=1 Tax=Chachezhania antarctica TaxID=2340860 RepID=UPI000EB416A2|nr:tetratricopeptide repeat protein [Chachezhania antarctica]|tara:strand:+ start:390 stop:998 length:609 start_codon:yes stop_codon:yes gene_type:complete